jgi:hypothetical protein
MVSMLASGPVAGAGAVTHELTRAIEAKASASGRQFIVFSDREAWKPDSNGTVIIRD